MRSARLPSVSCSGHPASRLLTAGFLTACAFLVTATLPGFADTVSLTPEQEAVVRSAGRKLVPPCCFQGTLAEHQSGVARKLRNELREMVAKGATEEEVVDQFTRKYGERILAEPRARGFNLLAYVLPAVGVAGGLAFILVFFRRAAKAALPGSFPANAKGFPATESNHSLRSRMNGELDRFKS